MSTLVNATEISLEAVPDCPQCGTAGLLLARFPVSMLNRHGYRVAGRGERLLCVNCDRSDPAAADLLALFLVDDRLDEANLLVFAKLAHRWARAVGSRSVDADDLAAQEEAWRRGEL